jgi:UTP--glucose-1-phosphate uridylyltransferase
MSGVIKKAVFAITEEHNKFFPLTRCTPKELLPLGEVTLIQKLVDEVVNCKIEEIIFLASSEKKNIIHYFQNLEKVSSENHDFREKYKNFLFTNFIQKKETGIGYSLFKAKEKIGDESFSLTFSDNILLGKKSAIEQLFAVYRTSQKQVIGIKEVGDDEVSSSYIVKTEKIANRLYKIKKIVKNPKPEEIESRLALAGRYILNPIIFDYLKNADTKTTIDDALNNLISAGKTIYGHECEGSWFSIKNKEEYLQTQNFLINK